MEEIIKLYEDHRERLIRQRKEVMETLNPLISEANATEDEQLREFVDELLGLASYIGSGITVIEIRIRKLKRKMKEEA